MVGLTVLPLLVAGQLGVSGTDCGGNPKLWCALSDGKVVVFDAASWSVQQNSVQVGSSQLVRIAESTQIAKRTDN